jgi:HD-GYP domain-containing protein (c-di-GMP phosphodiesterase class II)
MSSHRPYRPGLGIDKALAEIERGRTTLYDTDTADACLRLFREKRFVFQNTRTNAAPHESEYPWPHPMMRNET